MIFPLVRTRSGGVCCATTNVDIDTSSRRRIFMASRYQRFLLTATMDGAQAVNHCCRMNTDDAASGEALLNDIECTSIVGVPEDWNDDGRITDVKVGVASGKARMPVANVSGHRKLQHLQAVADQSVVILF